MSSIIHIDPAGRRETDTVERDYLDGGREARRPNNVVAFTPRLLRCLICMSDQHRAAKCPHRPGGA